MKGGVNMDTVKEAKDDLVKFVKIKEILLVFTSDYLLCMSLNLL